MRVLVTGGTGYIGSHTVVELILSGYEPIVVDNFVNSDKGVVQRIEQITGKSVTCFQLDIRDTEGLIKILEMFPCEAVFHFAGLKAVGESVENPLLYYNTNIDSTTSLIEAVIGTSNKKRPPRFIFSSSATVYGVPQSLPFTEEHPVGQNITNPYGQTKYMCEQIFKDISAAQNNVQAISLRYFNPIGAHPSGLLGENPKGIPNNLVPHILEVISGKRNAVTVYGTDYQTVDGTGGRDYLHVMDLASGHVAALSYKSKGFSSFNLGRGTATTVLQLINVFEELLQTKIPVFYRPRRLGDLPEFYSSPELANELLNWKAKYSLHDACRDSIRSVKHQMKMNIGN